MKSYARMPFGTIGGLLAVSAVGLLTDVSVAAAGSQHLRCGGGYVKSYQQANSIVCEKSTSAYFKDRGNALFAALALGQTASCNGHRSQPQATARDLSRPGRHGSYPPGKPWRGFSNPDHASGLRKPAVAVA